MKWLIAIGCALEATAAYAADDDAARNCMRTVRPAVIYFEAGLGVTDDEKSAIAACIREDALWPYDRSELKRVGLYDQLATAH